MIKLGWVKLKPCIIDVKSLYIIIEGKLNSYFGNRNKIHITASLFLNVADLLSIRKLINEEKSKKNNSLYSK